MQEPGKSQFDKVQVLTAVNTKCNVNTRTECQCKNWVKM